MKFTGFLLALFISQFMFAQNLQKGKFIKNYGSFFKVENPDFKTDTSKPLKVVFDVSRSFDNPNETNTLFEAAARFLNLHVDAGIPLDNIKIAIVVHGSAVNDILNDEQYLKRHPSVTTKINPNSPLLSQLAKYGAQIILCGQSAAYNNIDKSDTQKDVKMALSAMTALVQLQNEGYRLISF